MHVTHSTTRPEVHEGQRGAPAFREIALYLPDKKILLSAEVVQDHTFPNIYTIRGARYRDPVRWVASLTGNDPHFAAAAARFFARFEVPFQKKPDVVVR